MCPRGRISPAWTHFPCADAWARLCGHKTASVRTQTCPRGRAHASARTPLRGGAGGGRFQPLMGHIKAWGWGHIKAWGWGHIKEEMPSFPSPLQIARHGLTFPTLACLAFGWWRWVRLISLPPLYRLARK
jgi:hypothetical protein